jgi:hypothetical protein
VATMCLKKPILKSRGAIPRYRSLLKTSIKYNLQENKVKKCETKVSRCETLKALCDTKNPHKHLIPIPAIPNFKIYKMQRSEIYDLSSIGSSIKAKL